MYKKLTANDFKVYLNLPQNYHVDAVLAYGANRKKKHRGDFEQTLEKLGIAAKFRAIQENGFYENILALEIGDKTIWFDYSYGGAYLSELLHIGCMLGSNKNILLGSCAGLSSSGKANDIVIPVSSFGNESTTRMYQPDNGEFTYLADKRLVKRLTSRLNSKYPVIQGKMMTCQAAMMESWDDIVRWSEENYVGIDMESSTMFAVSNYFNVPSAALLHISDNLIHKQTLMDKDYSKVKEQAKEVKLELFRVAFEELLDKE